MKLTHSVFGFCVNTIPLIFFFVTCFNGAFAQREFIKTINGQIRSYIFNSQYSDNVPVNLPLVIILHTASGTSTATYSDLQKALTKFKIAAVFPQAAGKSWNCDSLSTVNDITFISSIIDEMYKNFKTDRNQVYIITSEENKCPVIKIKAALAGRLSDVVISDTNARSIENTLKKITGNPAATSSHFAQTADPAIAARLDSTITYRLKGRIIPSIRTGPFFMFGSVRSDVEDHSYMNMAKSNSYLGLNISGWFTDSLGWYIDISRIRGPRSAKIDGVEMSVEGGAIVPLTAGIKYNLLKKAGLTPYVSLGAGVLFISAAWGRFRSADSGHLNAANQTAPLIQPGAGISFRGNKRILLGAHLSYIHSARFESVGNINAVRGINAGVSIGYVIGANK